ncbi:MAG: cytidine deaminase [Bdellovibrionota bacterium]
MDSFKDLDAIYLKNISHNKYYLEECQWLSLAQSLKLSKKEFLFYALNYARNLSQPLISNFKVGAVGLGVSNKLYFGANIEFLKFPLNQTIHAEQALVSMAYSQMETGLKEVYLTAFPCGHCRQFMREMNNFAEVKIFVSSEKKKSFLLSQLLPNSFGPQDLQVTQYLFGKILDNKKFKFVHNTSKKISEQIKEKLLFALERSFCPYSQNPSAVVLQFNDVSLAAQNLLICGSCIESCAYNPSLSAFHMAYAQAILSKQDLKKLKVVYFSEQENAVVVHENCTRELLALVAPQAEFYVI